MPVKNARVLLAAPAPVLDRVAGARAYPAAGFAWTRPLTAFDRNAFRAYLYAISGHVAGAQWGEPMKQALLEHNPVLAPDRDNFQLKADKTYTLPEPTPIGGYTPFVWELKTAPSTISLWRGWFENVKQAGLVGITQEAFYAAARSANPTIQANELLAGVRYLLPVKSVAPLLYVATGSDSAGQFRFDGLPPGGYLLIVAGLQMEPCREHLYLRESRHKGVALAPKAETPAPPPGLALSADARFVRARNGHFFLGQQRISPFIGVNLRGLAHYGDQELLRDSKTSDRTDQLDAAARMGARVIRLFLANRHRSDEEILSRLRDALALVGQRGMFAIIAFTDFHKDSGFTLIHDDNKYKPGLPNTPETLDRAFYEKVEEMHYFRFVKKVVSEFKDDSRIFAWELGNELKAWSKAGAEPERHPDVFFTFARRVSELIRAIDRNHLIGTGIVSAGNVGFDATGAKQLYALETLDFQSIHLYYRPNGEKHPHNVSELALDFAAAVPKPILVGEIGVEMEAVGQDRSEPLNIALHEWFKERKAAGVLQWGFMATNANNNDGDNFRGMMRNKHADFDKLFETYRRWATDELPDLA